MAVDGIVREFLSVQFNAGSRRCWWWQRVPAPAHVACQACHAQSGAASMLLCDGCDRGYHMRCIGMRGQRPPTGDWVCMGCTRSHATTAGRTGRGARAHGPCA
jgi:hypothetical protein